MSNYDIVVSTISREKKQYVFEMLASLHLASEEQHQIDLVVGNPNHTYLNNLAQNKHVNIITCTESEWAMVKNKNTPDKFNLNFYRCLTENANKGALGRLYLEDDIVFKDGWDSSLERIIERLKQQSSEFVLSLYSAYDLSKAEGEVIQFDRGFYGTQAVFFTSGVIEGFADKVMAEGVLNYRHMADLLLQEYCNEKGIPLYVVKHSLVQHIGEESSIVNNFHKSHSF
jgi:hypothetical protein